MLEITDEKIKKYLQQSHISTEQQIFSYFMNITGESYRAVKSRSTLKIAINNHNYFIKKHWPVSLKEIIKNIISFKNPFTSAITEYRAINKLKSLKINTLDVAGFAECGRVNPKSFIISKSIEPNLELDKLCMRFVDHSRYYKLKRVIISVVAQYTRRLHLNGMNHRDYYLCHYLYNNKHGISQIKNLLDNFNNQSMSALLDNINKNIYLIDLHRMQMRKQVPIRYLMKDLVALLFSVRDLKLTKADKLRFIKIYMNISNKNKFKTFLRKELTFWQRVSKKSLLLREKG